MTYIAPVKDMLFVMNELAGLSDIIAYPRFSALGINAELIPQLLEKAAKNKSVLKHSFLKILRICQSSSPQLAMRLRMVIIP